MIRSRGLSQLPGPNSGRPLARTVMLWCGLSVAALFLFSSAVSAALQVRTGLRGSYFTNADWRGQPVFTKTDVPQDTVQLERRWAADVPAAFSVEWVGSLVVVRGGRYNFALTSDDDSWLEVDGTVIVDNQGLHSEQTRSGEIGLARGTHAVRLRYAQRGGDRAFTWQWARRGLALAPVPAWATIDAPAGLGAAVLAGLAHYALVASAWGASALALAAIAVGLVTGGSAVAARLRPYVVRLVGADAWPALPRVLAAAAILSLTGIWWGLPGGHWAPDEITPIDLWWGAGQYFSGGWGSRYPPLHYYVLAAVASPVWGLGHLGIVSPTGGAGDWINSLTTRAVSSVASTGTLLFLYATARRLVGRDAALFSVAQFALSAPFVYYSKMANVDVPYLFFCAVALWAYVRVVEHPQGGDLLVFGLASAAAIGTKDQAYGLLLLPAVWIFVSVRHSHKASRAAYPTLSALTDRRLWLAVTAALFALAAIHNVVFNWAGFMRHLGESAGGAREGSYRMFPSSLSGHTGLLALTLKLVRQSWGWPLSVVTMVGALWMGARREHWRTFALMLVPIVSYYVTFITVIGFNYDRFVLAMMLPASVYGGFACAQMLTWRRKAGVIAATAVFGYSVLYAGAVDVAMLTDNRFKVERFLREQSTHQTVIGFVFPVDYYPRFSGRALELSSLDQLHGNNPQYFVLNEDYANFEPGDTDRGLLIAGVRAGSAGYRRVLFLPGGLPLTWLPAAHPDLRSPRSSGEPWVTSSLRHISPSYGVYRRES